MGRARAAAERLIEVYDRHDPAQVKELYASNARISRPGAPELDRDGLSQFFGGFVQAMPDFRHRMVSVVEEGDRVGFECEVVGNFTGSLPTPNGPVPGTGSRVQFVHAQFLTVDADGQIAEDRDYTDMSVLMAQMGMAPAPA
jgi:predicted ester cyclase